MKELIHIRALRSGYLLIGHHLSTRPLKHEPFGGKRQTVCIQTTALISFHMFEFIREILLQVMFPLSGMLFSNTYITLMMSPLFGNSIPDTYITLVMFSYKEMLFPDAYIILMMLPLFGMLSPGAYITLMMLPLSQMLSPDACNILSLLLKSNYCRKNFLIILFKICLVLCFIPLSLSLWPLIVYYIFIIYSFSI